MHQYLTSSLDIGVRRLIHTSDTFQGEKRRYNFASFCTFFFKVSLSPECRGSSVVEEQPANERFKWQFWSRAGGGGIQGGLKSLAMLKSHNSEQG